MVGLSSPLWPVHPKPFAGEALSSWLLRVAEGNGLEERAFKRYLPTVPGTGADIDLIGDDAFFAAFATWSGLPQEQLAHLGYARDEGLIYIRNTTTHLDWIIPHSRLSQRRGKPSNSAQPFCPSCLASDTTPYYRKVWRYAFHPICPEHGLLADRCDHCGNSLGYLGGGNAVWNRLGSSALKGCLTCGAPFRDSQQLALGALEQSALTTQSALLEGLTSGWFRLDGRLIHIALFLQGLHMLADAFLSPEHGRAMTAWVAMQQPQVGKENILTVGKGDLEQQSSLVRAQLIVCAFWLAQKWPSRWLDLLRETGTPASGSLPSLKSLPAWMHHEEFERLRARASGRSPDEIKSAKKLLGKLRGYAANEAETTTFMDTGIIPEVKPRSRTVPPEVRDLFSQQFGKRSPDSGVGLSGMYSPPIRELYTPTQMVAPLSELLEEMDDTETSLPTFKRKQRLKREGS